MKIIGFFIAVLTGFSAFGQHGIDIKAFNEKTETAVWLKAYDGIAWKTSDSVMTQDTSELKRLGAEWFCFQDAENNWHAVYGKYDTGTFDQVFHYLVNDSFQVARSYEQVDTSILLGYSRALITANEQIRPVRDSIPIRFNQFIRQEPDGGYTVWIFPAFQPDATAIYGGEFIYSIDRNGTTVLEDNSYFEGGFRGFKVGEPREIWLNYQHVSQPTLGAVFFAIYYDRYFSAINIETSAHVTRLINEDGQAFWVHVEKNDQPSNKKKRRKKKK
ncbi:MAG: hypothetical protein R3B47_10080 [Bacteroidia bacterium]